jgi:hypothetical protein
MGKSRIQQGIGFADRIVDAKPPECEQTKSVQDGRSLGLVNQAERWDREDTVVAARVATGALGRKSRTEGVRSDV